MKKKQTAKDKSLLKLQREYLEKTISKLDEVIQLSLDLSELEDTTLIEAYMEKIRKVEAEADENYKIACDIENVIKR